ncbi:Rv0361 family membrane protein [Micromonospora sp. NPDC003197]
MPGQQAFPGQPQFPDLPPGQPGYGPPPAPPKKRRGLLIVSIVLAVVLVLCGGGGVAAFLILRDTQTGTGAEAPEAAVENFLEAVYVERDAKKAAELVCSEARDDDAIKKKVDGIKTQIEATKDPKFRWTALKVDDKNEERAIVSTKLTLITSDEKMTEQQLKFTVVQKTGWWVCEVA